VLNRFNVLNDPVNWIDPLGLEMALPAPVPLPIILPTTSEQQEANEQLGGDIHDAWMDYVHPPLMAAGDLLYGGGIGEWIYDITHEEAAPCYEARKGKYKKPTNPNKRKGAEDRQKAGDRERNVGHPDGEEHSRIPKGPKKPRVYRY